MTVLDMFSEAAHALVECWCGAGVPLCVWYLWLSLSPVIADCEDRDVKQALLDCGPLLAEISTSILLSPSGNNRNYSHVCREFREYVICTDPMVAGCDSVLMTDYITSKEIYTDDPYNCELPAGHLLRRTRPLTSSAVTLHLSVADTPLLILNQLLVTAIALVFSQTAPISQLYE